MGYTETLLEKLNAGNEELLKRNEAFVEEVLKNELDEQIKAQSEKDPMVPFEQRREDVRHKMLDALDPSQLNELIAKSYGLLHDHAKEVLTKEEREKVIEDLKQVEKHPKVKDLTTPIAKTLNLPISFLESFMKVGNALYEKERIDEAKTIYSFLIVLNPTFYNFWVGLGHCFTHKGDHESAAIAYYFAVLVRSDQPLSYILAANSFLKINEKENAKQLLQAAEALLKKEPNPELQKVLTQLKRGIR